MLCSCCDTTATFSAAKCALAMDWYTVASKPRSVDGVAATSCTRSCAFCAGRDQERWPLSGQTSGLIKGLLMWGCGYLSNQVLRVLSGCPECSRSISGVEWTRKQYIRSSKISSYGGANSELGHAWIICSAESSRTHHMLCFINEACWSCLISSQALWQDLQSTQKGSIYTYVNSSVPWQQPLTLCYMHDCSQRK